MSCDNYPSKKDVEDFALNAKVINEFTTESGELTTSAASDGKQKITLAEIWRQANEKSVTELFLYSHTWYPWIKGDTSITGAVYRYTWASGHSTLLLSIDGSVMGDVPDYDHFSIVGLMSVKDFGAVGDGVTSDHAAIQMSIIEAEKTGTEVHLPAGTYLVDSPLIIKSKMSLVGDGQNSSVLEFSGADLVGNAAVIIDAIASGATIISVRLQGIGLSGSPSFSGLRINADLTRSLIDSSFYDLRIYNFSVGIISEFAFDNIYQNVRVQSCRKSIELNSQTNATQFDRCSFVSASIASTLINAEGIIMNACDFSNQSGDYAFTLYQSYLQMNTPYFEYVPSNLALVGSASEQNGSSLLIYGGLVSGNVIALSNSACVVIEGARQPVGSEVFILSPAAPTVSPRLARASVTGKSPELRPVTDNKPLYENHYSNISPFPAYGGGSLTLTRGRDFAIISNSSGSGSGLYIPFTFTDGDVYTIYLQMRHDSGSVTIRDSLSTLSIATPATDEEWSVHQSTWIARGTAIYLLFTGELQIKTVMILSGAVNTGEIKRRQVTEWYADSIPISDDWVTGDRVYNRNPAAGKDIGWVYTSDKTWVSMGVI